MRMLSLGKLFKAPTSFGYRKEAQKSTKKRTQCWRGILIRKVPNDEVQRSLKNYIVAVLKDSTKIFLKRRLYSK